MPLKIVRNLFIALGLIVGLFLSVSPVRGAVCAPYQGCTGIGITTSSDMGKIIAVSSTGSFNDFKYKLIDLPAAAATPTWQQVTDQGATTNRAVQFAGGTSTAAFTIQGLLTAPTGSFTMLYASNTNFTLATIGTITASNATITNVSNTYMSVLTNLDVTTATITGFPSSKLSDSSNICLLNSNNTFTGTNTFATGTFSQLTATNVSSTNLTVNNKLVCLADGTNCLPTSTPTLQQVATAGNTTSLALIFAGGTSTANFVVTGTLNAQTTTVSQFSATNGASIVGNMTVSGNATLATTTITALTATSATSTNLFATSATIGTLTLTTPLGMPYGGSNANLTASNGGLVYSTASALAILPGTATAGQIPRSGANAAPSWSTATYPATAGSAGTIMRSDGTNWLASTLTMPNTTAVSTILYSSSANTIAALATANNGVLVTDGSGVPSIGSTLPTAVQSNITSVGTLTALTVSGATSLQTTTVTNFTASRTSTLATTTIANLSLTTPLTYGNGGSGNTSYTTNGVIIASTSQFVSTATGTANQVLTSNGGSTAPTFQTLPTATYGTSTLSSDFTLSASAGTFQDTGLSVTLPSAGVYFIYATVRAQIAYSAGVEAFAQVKFYNSTDATYLDDGSMGAYGNTSGTGNLRIHTIPLMTTVYVNGSKTIKLYAARMSATTFVVSTISANSEGGTRMGYIKMSN